MDTSQSQRFLHLVGETARRGIPRLKRTQRRPYESIWEGVWVGKDQEAGEGRGEQKCEKLRGNGKPGTTGGGGTEEVARGWATRSELETLSEKFSSARQLPELYTLNSPL